MEGELPQQLLVEVDSCGHGDGVIVAVAELPADPCCQTLPWLQAVSGNVLGHAVTIPADGHQGVSVCRYKSADDAPPPRGRISE